MPVRTPALRSSAGSVSTQSNVCWLWTACASPYCPFWCVWRPVSRTARLELHDETVAKALVNRVPRAASRSRFGVCTTASP